MWSLCKPEADEAEREYNLRPVNHLQDDYYDAIIIAIAVAHDQFRGMEAKTIRKLGRESHILYDLKHLLPATKSDLRL